MTPELSKQEIENVRMREFVTGATRDVEETKIDYEGFLSPLVIEAYGRFMDRHRRTPRGLRDSDNWQKGIPLNVYMKSGFRHFCEWWSMHRKWKPDNIENAEEFICALLFNASGYLHERLVAARAMYPQSVSSSEIKSEEEIPWVVTSNWFDSIKTQVPHSKTPIFDLRELGHICEHIRKVFYGHTVYYSTDSLTTWSLSTHVKTKDMISSVWLSVPGLASTMRSITEKYEPLGSEYYVLRIRDAPGLHRERWPVLRLELNNAEWSEREQWQRLLYEWIQQNADGSGTWRLHSEHVAWSIGPEEESEKNYGSDTPRSSHPKATKKPEEMEL